MKLLPATLIVGSALSTIPAATAQPEAPPPPPIEIPKAPDLLRIMQETQAVANQVEKDHHEGRYKPIEEYISSLKDIQLNIPAPQPAPPSPATVVSQPTPQHTVARRTSDPNNQLGNAIVDTAMQYLGTAYVWGGSTPATGFDCSGLIQWAHKQHGVSIPRTTYQQLPASTPVARSDVRAGDLVFYNSTGHVALAISPTQVIHAPQTGDVVRIASIDMMPVEHIGRFI